MNKDFYICKVNCGRTESHEHSLILYNGQILKDEDFELKNGKALPGGWSQSQIFVGDKSIGFIESGEIVLNDEAMEEGYSSEEYKVFITQPKDTPVKCQCSNCKTIELIKDLQLKLTNQKPIWEEDQKSLEFSKLAEELKQWLEERDLKLGYTDTYLGQLALLIQKKETAAYERGYTKGKNTVLHEQPIHTKQIFESAFHQGQIEQLKEDIKLVTVDINSVKYEERKPILEALQDKLENLNSKGKEENGNRRKTRRSTKST